MTRDDILNAAASIFSEKGFHATSMQDIAEAVNLQKASLYHHVSSKQEILVALLDEALDILIDRIGKVVSQPLLPEEKLRQSMVTYMQTLLERKDLAAILLLEHRSLNAELRTRHVPRRDRFEILWKEMIKEGIDKGIFINEDPGFITRSVLGMLNWTITWYHPEGPLTPNEIAEHYADLAIMGIIDRNHREHQHGEQ